MVIEKKKLGNYLWQLRDYLWLPMSDRGVFSVMIAL